MILETNELLVGHTFRMEQRRIPKKGLRCDPTKGNREGQKWPWEKPLRKTLKRWPDMGNGRERSKSENFMEKKGVAALSPVDRSKQRRRRSQASIYSSLKT